MSKVIRLRPRTAERLPASAPPRYQFQPGHPYYPKKNRG